MDNPEKLATLGSQDTRRGQTKQKHNTIGIEYHCTQANTNSIHNTWTLLQTTEGIISELCCALLNTHSEVAFNLLCSLYHSIYSNINAIDSKILWFLCYI